MARRLIGTGTTDSNGRVTIEYTGTGAGRVQVTAETTDGSLSSETYEILDAIFLDWAVTGDKNDNWINYSNRLTVETDDTGTLLTGYASSNGYYFANGDNPFIFSDYTCEFDVVEIAGSSRWYHQNSNTNNENVFVLNTWINSACHVRITVEDGVATLYVDDVQKTTFNLTVESPYELGFRFTNGTSNTLKYKNFLIY